MQTKLRQKEFAKEIDHLMMLSEIRKKHEIVTTLAQLHLDYARESKGLTIYLDQDLKQQLQLF